MATKKKITKPVLPPAPVPKNYKCSRCGLETSGDPQKYFYFSNSRTYDGNDHYMTLCKTCCKEMFKDYYLEYGNELKAMRRMCMRLDLYYDDTLIDSANKTSVATGSLFSSYMTAVNRVQNKGKTFDDSLRAEDLLIHTKADLDKVNEDKKVLAEKTVDVFGPGYTQSEYQFLQKEYKDWVTRYECSTKAQEELFQILSILKLRIRKAAAANDQKGLDSATKSFQDTLGTANLQPKQARNNAMVEANTLGTLIEKWENEDPIPEPDPDFEDVDGIKRFITVWFQGHLCKMLGIKNDAAEEYEREKAKYSVERRNTFADGEDEENAEIANILKAAMSDEDGDSNV